MFLVFGFPPLLVMLLASLLPFVSPKVLKTCIAVVEVSPLGVTALIAYFFVVLALWSRSLSLYFKLMTYSVHGTAIVLFPRLLPFDQVFKGIFLRYKYRRWHISHMRLDRFRRLVDTQNKYTVFIAMPYGPTLPLCTFWFFSVAHTLLILGSVVSDSTTVQDIERELARRCLFPIYHKDLPYISINGSCSRSIKSSDTMGGLSAGPLSHLQIRCRFLGGSGAIYI